jgi:hypothetical protein
MPGHTWRWQSACVGVGITVMRPVHLLMRLPTPLFGLCCVALWGCKDKDVDASGEPEPAVQGEACAPFDASEDETPQCAEGLACEPTAAGDGDDEADFVCGAPLEIRGKVFDALSGAPIEGAHVSALDETGAPVSDVAVSDVDGNYVLLVSARRDPDGEIVDALKWTLFATAADYQPFPAGVRPAIPINALDATDDPESEEPVVKVIVNASTDVALLQLPEDQRGGRIISGTIGEIVDEDNDGDPDRAVAGAGTLVVAEGTTPAPYTIADASGFYTLFNVPEGAVTIVGYRQGLGVASNAPSGAGDLEDVDLVVETEGVDALPTVSGSVNLVNAEGGATTSVVLVPASVYNELLERGPVPFGLRAPQLPEVPTVQGAFAIPGVPPGTYKVLAAFENDDLVRDPDEGIAGTDIQEITVAGNDVPLEASFKITQDLAVISPGAEVPELVDGTPTFVWADDSSEDYYHLVVYDAFGELVWEDPMVARVTGAPNVEVEYGGDALVSGMYYQFRATSFRDRQGDATAISRTEDLRGVFVAP